MIFSEICPSFSQNVLWAQRSANQDPTTAAVELVLWIVIFIAALILGVLYLKKLRADAKAEPSAPSDKDVMDRFEEYYRQKLITYDEFQMIRKNFRDQLVFEVYQADKREKENVKRRKNRQPIMDESEKERRLKSLLKGLGDRN